jgi:negative regulator of flagellin synthesis FlgM
MKISGNADITKYINDATVNKTQETGKGNAAAPDAAPDAKKDTVVNLSQKSRDVQAAQKAVEAQPDIRAEKVQTIADKISNGTYRVDPEKTAEKIMLAFFEEMA